MEEKKRVKVKSFKELKNVKKTGFVDLEYSEAVLEVPIKSVSPSITDEIEDKYDAMKPAVPAYFDKGLKKWLEIPKDTSDPSLRKQYIEYEKKIKKIDSNKFAELVLQFLDIEIDGETVEDKIKVLREEIPLGNYYKIIEAGYKLSGVDFDEKVDTAKNS